jgi:FkbM family methyltransferase
MASLRQLLQRAGLSSRKPDNAHAESLRGLQKAVAEDNKALRKELDKLRKSLEQRFGELGNPAPARTGTMAGILKRLHHQGPKVETIIDIGASDGQWAQMASEWFPHQHYLLVEAQPVHDTALKAYASTRPQVQVCMAAAGSQPGEIHFDATDPYGGIASPTPFPENNIVVPVTTLDHEVKNRVLPGPFLIKFDTHGFEVPILEGAAEVVKQTAVIIMECYNFKISPDCILFYEMCAYLAKQGFRCVDMADVVHREQDRALWQMDMVFVKEDRQEFQHSSYRW